MKPHLRMRAGIALLASLVLSAGLGGCGPRSGGQSPPSATSGAGVQALASPALSSAVTAPAGVSLAPMLETDYDNAVRVIPPRLDPTTQFASIVAQYRQLTDEPQPVGWFGGTVNGAFNFQIGLSLPVGFADEIELQFPVRARITLTEAAAGDLDVLSPLFGGGGGATNTFAEFELTPGQLELLPTQVSVVRLAADAAAGVAYDFHAVCAEAGVYHLDFLMPYAVHADALVQSGVVRFESVLACPARQRVWLFDPDSGALAGDTTMVLDDGAYVPAP